MKKFVALICAAAMTLGMVSTAMAAPSIGELIPEAPKVVSGNIPEGYTLEVKNVDTASYENKTVADIVTKFNDETSVTSVKEVLETLNVDLTQEIKTESGTVIKPEEYEPVMPFADLVLSDGTKTEYTVDGKIKATVKAEIAKDLDKDSIIIMQIDPKTGKVYFIEIEEYDPETGEITAEFPCMGPFTIMQKSEVPE